MKKQREAMLFEIEAVPKAASVRMEGVEAKSGRATSKAKASEAEEAGHPQGEKLLPNFLSQDRKKVSLNDCFQSSVPSSGLAEYPRGSPSSIVDNQK